MNEESIVYSPVYMRTDSSAGRPINGERSSIRNSSFWLLNRISGASKRSDRPSSPQPLRTTQLQGRLQDMVIFELREDGGREFLSMTLRSLYDYVLNCITNRPKAQLIVDTYHKQSSEMDDKSCEFPDLPSTTEKIAHGLSHLDRRLRSISSGSARANTGDHLQNMVTVQSDGFRNAPQGVPRERLGGYLHPRDMRRLVTPFSSSNEPELMVRRHVMLMNFDPLRAIILRDRLLILVPDGADSILNELEKRLRGDGDDEWRADFDSDASSLSHRIGHTFETTDDVERGNVKIEVLDPCIIHKEGSKNEDDGLSMGSTDEDTHFSVENEWNDLDERHFIQLPFELQAVDALLATVHSILSNDAAQLKHNIQEAIDEFLGSSSPGDHIQDQLRSLKDSIHEMEGRVQGVVRALNQTLDEEEDMALMNLSRLLSHPERFLQPVSQDILNEESDEPELILEAYLQQALSEYNALVLLKGNIASTEGLVGVKLDSIRNRLLYVNTLVTFLTLCVAFASVIGCMLGMNLLNPLRFYYERAWWPVVYSTTIFTTLMIILFIWSLRRLGIRA